MKKLVLILVFIALSAMTANATPFGNGPAVIQGSSLQSIVTNVFYDSTISAADDQSDVRVWNNTDGAATAYEIVYLAGNTNTLGLYDYVTSARYDLSLSSSTISKSVSFEFIGNELLVNNISVGGGWSGSFGFFLNSSETYQYTEDSKNSGATQAVAYQIGDGTKYNLAGADGSLQGYNVNKVSDGGDDWLLAFEDIEYAGSDKDFNDAVFYVKDLTPVPEPGTLLLLGSGLVGLAFLKRRKQA